MALVHTEMKLAMTEEGVVTLSCRGAIVAASEGGVDGLVGYSTEDRSVMDLIQKFLDVAANRRQAAADAA